jgi:hypothetical protein
MIDNNRQNDFVEMFKDFAQFRNPHTIFGHFIEIAAIELWQPFCRFVNPQQFETNKQTYQNILSQYKDDEKDTLVRLLAFMVEGMEYNQEHGGGDWLGEVFHKLELHNKNTSQFFTPFHLSLLLGKINFDTNLENEIKERGFMTLNDPCCGAGSLILGFTQVMEEAGYNYQQKLLVVANDLDSVAANMAYIQLSLNGIAAIVSQQNTLTQEIYWTKITPMYFTNEWQSKIKTASLVNKMKFLLKNVNQNNIETENEPVLIPSTESKQLTFF